MDDLNITPYVQYAGRVLEARSAMIQELLVQRGETLTSLAQLGSGAETMAIQQIKKSEGTLRRIDEALGLLRYGEIPGDMPVAKDVPPPVYKSMKKKLAVKRK